MVEEQIKELKEITNTQKDSELTKALGMSKGVISTWRGRGKVPDNVLEKAKKGGFKISSVSVRLYDIAASAGTGSLVEYEPSREVELSDALRIILGITSPSNARLLHVQGDSMIPTLQDGSLIAIESINNFANDGIYVFNWDEELFIKRLQRIKEGVRVMSDNNMYESWVITKDEMQDRDFAILGRVTGCCQRL
ncbi:S24 family peptidase [Vibrio sp. 10N.261.46.A3]|uniref:LexA family transcriptional regulator n=1 Tax=Vibrio sp. 10N.261.46.A3 TaxID=3229658 RepID=UPI003551E7C4